MEHRSLLPQPIFPVRVGVPPLGPAPAEISGASADKGTIPPAMARSAIYGNTKAANGSGRKAPPQLAKRASMASPPAPSSTPTWATAQDRASLLAIGTCSILLPNPVSSGCSADRASIPPGRTATACSATCGDICLTRKPNGSHQKAAGFDSVKACGFCVSAATLAVTCVEGRRVANLKYVVRHTSRSPHFIFICVPAAVEAGESFAFAGPVALLE